MQLPLRISRFIYKRGTAAVWSGTSARPAENQHVVCKILKLNEVIAQARPVVAESPGAPTLETRAPF